jgi:hypothetical protein
LTLNACPLEMAVALSLPWRVQRLDNSCHKLRMNAETFPLVNLNVTIEQ